MKPKMAIFEFYTDFAHAIHVSGRNSRTLCPICPDKIFLNSGDQYASFATPQAYSTIKLRKF